MPAGPKETDLGELDLLALATLAIALAIAFDHSERWLRQHLFKVGWLLGQNRKVTIVFYYALYLPGLLLHGLSYWLAAGILNVRAKRATSLPQLDDIRKRELGFVRVAPNASPIRLAVIEVTPLLIALAALWAITNDILAVGATWQRGFPGDLDSIAATIRQLITQADFWLWFYLAFTIANTMSPSIPDAFGVRRRWLLLLVLPALVGAVLLGLGGTRSSEFTLAIEGLLQGLNVILLCITTVNLMAALVLGSMEAFIERVTGHSATIVDGKLTTVAREEAQGPRKSQRRKPPRPSASPKPASRPRSIYGLPLPIPGPPGIEPVSRTATAVLNPHRTKQAPANANAAPEAHVLGKMSAASISAGQLADVGGEMPDDRAGSECTPFSVAAAPEDSSNLSMAQPKTAEPGKIVLSGENAPFSRPFVLDEYTVEDPHEDIERAQETGFARPFSLPAAAESATIATVDDLSATADTESEIADTGEADMDATSAGQGQFKRSTRPAPKPSQREKPVRDQGVSRADGNELQYEAMEDGDD